MEGMAHDGARMDGGFKGDSPFEPDEILMSVAMSRLCMQSYRVVRAVRAEVCVNERLVSKAEGEAKAEAKAEGEGEIFQFDTDTEDNKEEDNKEEDGGTMEGMELTNADIASAVSMHVWDEWLAVVRRELRQMQEEDERVGAAYRIPGTEEHDQAHLMHVMRKLSEVWRLRDHVLGFMDERADIEEDTGVNSEWIEKMTFFLMCSIGADELEEEGLKTTRLVRAKHGDAGLNGALERWLGGQRSVAWWLRESA